MTPSHFPEFCERLWNEWIAGAEIGSEEIRRRFDLNAAPEPYLQFVETARPLVVVTTNPGATMDHQRREEVLAGRSVIGPEMTYRDAAAAFAELYGQSLEGPAGRRIKAQQELAEAAGFEGVMQVECVPWHSATMPAKDKVVQLMRDEPLCRRYSQSLSVFLAEHTVVALSAVSTRRELSPASVQASPWLTWQAELLGLQVDRSEFIELGSKGSRTTSAALIDQSGREAKALVLMMGGNHWPKAESRAVLAQRLRS